jgi:hypothetical protein
MKSVIAVFAAATLAAVFALPASAERLNDKQAKATIENIDRGFDAWKDSLERRNLDDAVIRSAAGTVDVRRFLDDFEKEIHQVKDRMKPDYAANTEVTSLLRLASDVERRAQAGQAAPEWKAMSSQFSALAAAYGTSFPMPSADATASRLTDNELARQIEDMEQQAKRVSSEADKAMKAAKATDAERDKVKQALNALAASAKQTRSMVKSGTASAAQATALLSATSAAKGLVGGLPMAGPGKTAWSSIDRGAAALAKAFGATW